MAKEPIPKLPQAHLRRLAKSALEEDQAGQDVTTTALVPPDQKGRGVIIAREEGVLAGLPMAEAAFKAVDPSLHWQPLATEGSRLSPGQEVARIEGPLAAILQGERVSLNYLTHLSGIATATARLVAAIAGLPIVIRDTRRPHQGQPPGRPASPRPGHRRGPAPGPPGSASRDEGADRSHHRR
jgi:nicotinate-nucleotide pyrophosphorylase (carboxylating)